MAFFSQREVKRSHNIMKTFNFIAAVIASAMFTINAHAEMKSVNETKDTSAVEISKSSKRAMVQTSEDGKVYKYEYILDNNGRVVNKIASRWNDDNSEWTPVSAYSVVYTNTETFINNHNSEFIENHLTTDSRYLDEILLKDDPNIKLDEEQRRVVLSDEDYTLVIAGAGAGKTVFFSTHVMEVAEKLCDRIGIIKQGKLIFVGTMNELKEEHGKEGQSLEDIFLELIGSTAKAGGDIEPAQSK